MFSYKMADSTVLPIISFFLLLFLKDGQQRYQPLSDAPTFPSSSRAFEICASLKPSNRTPLSTPK
ncbi:hypothetical protein OIU84_023854, partial [Salix udensis]